MKKSLFCKRNCVAAVSLLIGLLFAAVSCGKLAGNIASGDKGDDEQSKALHDYILVRGDGSGADVLRQVLNLKHAMDERFENETLSSTDWAVDMTSEGKTRREILVGVTSRSESLAANEELSGTHGYVIRSYGEKIVITASTVGQLEKAVEHFVREYVDTAKGSVLPKKIDVINKEQPPLCVMSDNGAMRLFLSEHASDALEEAVGAFADRVEEHGGIRPEIIKDIQLPERRVVVSLKNTVLTEETDRPAGDPGAVGGDGWSMSLSDGKITLDARDDSQAVAALAGLYEHLSGGADRTLDGKSVFFYEKVGVYKEGWSDKTPRVLGATYLGTESISGNSKCSYYENVCFNAFGAWKQLLLKEELGGYTVQNGSTSEPIYLSFDKKTEVSIYYNSDDRTLSVVEQSR
jgi:hypothetical protein